MSTTTTARVDAAVADGTTTLRALRGVSLAEARTRVQVLAARHVPLKIDLVPERNEYTQELELALLIRAPEAETVYLTCRAPSGTPWLLHQVHDFREGVLLAVDGESLTVGEAVASLDEWLGHASLRERMVDTCLLNRCLRERNDPVSDDELQAAVDEIRQRRGLHTVEATEAWMRATGTSEARLEELAASSVRVRKLRHAVCGPQVERHFSERPDEITRAALIRLRFANAELARQARVRATSPADFFALANQMIAEDLRQAGASDRLDTLVASRFELEPAFAAEVFSRAGAVVGPQVTPEGAYLAVVSSLEPATVLDGPTRDLIERRLFEQWLREQRAQASIEWNWGRNV